MPDYDRNRAERDFNLNPPANAPGQGGDDWDALFADTSGSNTGTPVNNFSGVDTDINSILNGDTNQTSSTPSYQSFGDVMGSRFDQAATMGAKGIWSYLKVVVSSLMNNTANDWNMLGTRLCKISVGVFLFSVVESILSVTVLRSLEDGSALALGSCMGLLTGVILLGFNRKSVPAQDVFQSNDVGFGQEDMGIDFDSDSSDEYIDESPYSEDEDDFEDSSMFGSSNDFSGDYFSEFSASNNDFNVEEAVNSLPDVPRGQYTRQYLFETFSKVLPLLQPSFMDMIEVYDSSDEFMMFEDYLRRSAEQTGVKEDKLDELQLLQVRKNLFIIQLVATRPTGLKEKDIADGIADCYKRDDYGMVIQGREGVFGRVNSQVGRLLIDIFLCNDVMVSLGDVFKKKADFILNTNNVMPLIWGISEMGTVFCYDGMKDGNGGMIISGEARSGKSWKGQSLIAQMCMFMSPKQLELYFYDVKGEASDYAYLSRVLPHCKGFCGDALKFNDSIEKLLTREAKRRTDLIGGKYTNVKDYNKDHPLDTIPTIYIVIDEMATAMSEMKDKDIDIRKKFDSLLIQIATKYPYLEIKLLLFPHRIVNDIINKTVSSMISTRSVMGNVPADDLKTALDIKKDFPYSLVKTGDMAIKTKSLNNGNAVYSHSEVLSTDEQVNRKIFDYIGEVWRRLEPDSVGITNQSNTIKKSLDIVKSSPVDTSISESDFDYATDVFSQDVLDSKDSDVDESFWDEVIHEDKGKEDSSLDGEDDFDWSNFG